MLWNLPVCSLRKCFYCVDAGMQIIPPECYKYILNIYYLLFKWRTYDKFTVIGENNVFCGNVEYCKYRNIISDFLQHFLNKKNLPITYIEYIFFE